MSQIHPLSLSTRRSQTRRRATMFGNHDIHPGRRTLCQLAEPRFRITQRDRFFVHGNHTQTTFVVTLPAERQPVKKRRDRSWTPVPCHRVVRADGTPGGWRWGVARKQALLEREISHPPASTV